MTEGNRPILVRSALAGLAIVTAACVLLAPWNGTAETMVMIGVVGAVFAVVILPRAHQLDRSIAALGACAEAAACGVASPAPRSPAWLRDTLGPVARAIDTMRNRVESSVASGEQKRANLLVAREESRIARAALDGLSTGVLVTNCGPSAGNEILMLNQAAAEMLRTDPTRTLHRPLAEVAGPQLVDVVTAVQIQGSETMCSPAEQRVALSSDDGRTFDATLAALWNDRDEISAVVTLLRDRTSECRQSSLGADLVAHVSHELRTPLSALRAYVELLTDGEIVGEAARREAFETMRGETDRMGRLIDNVLTLSRVEAGDMDIDWQPVDVGTLVARAARVIEPHAEAKQIGVETSLPGFGLVARGDPDMLYQVVLNLASNAVKYTSAGGRVVMTAHEDPLARSIVVSVADTGCGIPAQETARLFDKFYRVKGHSRAAEGSGLGLCLCKHIVETVHGGRIDVRSSPGVGSEFSFTIPARSMRLTTAA